MHNAVPLSENQTVTTAGCVNDTVSYTVDSGIAWLSFDPLIIRQYEVPAVNRAMIRALDEIEFDQTVGVLVLAFESNACLPSVEPGQQRPRGIPPKGQDADRAVQSEAYSWWGRLHTFPKPTIAMVRESPVSGAYNPVSACDLAFADENALFVICDNNRGLVQNTEGYTGAAGHFPLRKLMYQALTGDGINASIAAEWGLINRAVPADRLQASVTQVAKTLLGKNPDTLKAIKDSFRKAPDIASDTRRLRHGHTQNIPRLQR